jgi:hypothetical protein
MTKLEEITTAIKGLSPEKLAEFRAWYEEFDAAVFDAKIERDAKNGRLDELAQQALKDYREGRATKL